MEEFLQLVNTWHNYKQKIGWLFYTPFRLGLFPQRCWTCQVNKITSAWCHDRQKLLLIAIVLTGRFIWLYYQQISKFCIPVLSQWLTDWRHQRLTDCWLCTAFCCDIFSLFQQLCTVVMRFLIWPVWTSLCWGNTIYFIKHIHKTVFDGEVLHGISLRLLLEHGNFWT